ncbi:hypothetical protein AX774_g5378, partial [Zancudomyces culisetae]
MSKYRELLAEYQRLKEENERLKSQQSAPPDPPAEQEKS